MITNQKDRQDYRVFHFSFKTDSDERPQASISSKMLQRDAFDTRPNHFISIQFIMSKFNTAQLTLQWPREGGPQQVLPIFLGNRKSFFAN